MQIGAPFYDDVTAARPFQSLGTLSLRVFMTGLNLCKLKRFWDDVIDSWPPHY